MGNSSPPASAVASSSTEAERFPRATTVHVKLRLAERPPSVTVTVTWYDPGVRTVPVINPDAALIDNPAGKPFAVNWSRWPSGSLADKASETFSLALLV